MKKIMTIIAAVLFCGILSVSSALAAFIADNYIGADYSDVKPKYVLKDGDVITNNANLKNFDINGMDVTLSGGVMTVKIDTAYTPLFGTTYGDLFISTNGWNPYGASPYTGDSATNGETWEYVFDVSSGNLYNIDGDNQDNILLSNSQGFGDGLYRKDQEVLIDSDGLKALTSGGKATKQGNFYVMTFDVSGMLPSDFTGTLGFHWGMTCANDVIEGSINVRGGGNVPLPAAVWLLGSGLLGLVGIRWRSSTT